MGGWVAKGQLAKSSKRYNEMLMNRSQARDSFFSKRTQTTCLWKSEGAERERGPTSYLNEHKAMHNNTPSRAQFTNRFVHSITNCHAPPTPPAGWHRWRKPKAAGPVPRAKGPAPGPGQCWRTGGQCWIKFGPILKQFSTELNPFGIHILPSSDPTSDQFWTVGALLLADGYL